MKGHPMDMTDEKSRASAWFEDLRNQICASFEALEDQLSEGPHVGMEPGRFTRKETFRDPANGDGGGGVMSVMKGRVFEKVGVNISTVYGSLGEAAQRSMRARPKMEGVSDDPRFWAAGISLVAHMWNPLVPAVHTDDPE